MDTRAQCHPLRPRGGPRRSGFKKNGFARPDMYWKVSRHLSLCKLEATPSTPPRRATVSSRPAHAFLRHVF